jgi:haloacetate dehalogenase
MLVARCEAEEGRTMTPITHHTIRANGIRQHYREAGSGPPVVLLHGFPETG